MLKNPNINQKTQLTKKSLNNNSLLYLPDKPVHVLQCRGHYVASHVHVGSVRSLHCVLRWLRKLILDLIKDEYKNLKIIALMLYFFAFSS